MRTTTVRNNNEVTRVTSDAILEVDSGWDTSQPEGRRIAIDFKTTRGKTVSLSIADWIKLKNEVDLIIEHCALQMQGVKP